MRKSYFGSAGSFLFRNCFVEAINLLPGGPSSSPLPAGHAGVKAFWRAFLPIGDFSPYREIILDVYVRLFNVSAIFYLRFMSCARRYF